MLKLKNSFSTIYWLGENKRDLSLSNKYVDVVVTIVIKIAVLILRNFIRIITFNFFQVKDIYLHPDPFSVTNGLLTPALKAKRPQLKAYFKPQLEDLYQHLD